MRFETHSHSHYSNIRLIDAICKPKDLITTAYNLGYSGICLTDHEALCGHVEWLQLEKELKQKNIISENFKCGLGNEIYLVEERTPEEKQKYFHFILIAKNTEGHRALRELSSNSWLNSYRYRGLERVPTLKKELETIVSKYPNTLIATNACLGSELDGLVLQLIEAEKEKQEDLIYEIKVKIDSFIKWCIFLFKDDFYIEIAPGTSKDQKNFNKRIKSIASFYNLKIIIATDAHYLSTMDRNIHKSFLNSKDGEREVDSFYYDAHLMSDKEAYDNLKDIYTKEEFDIMCKNSLEVMNKIGEYKLFHSPIIPQVQVEMIPKNIDYSIQDYKNLFYLISEGNDQERYWAHQCLTQLKEKGLFNQRYLERLDTEADVLIFISEKMNNCLFSYFNTMAHYINLFWECGSLVGPGRGSACGFLSNYLLGITQLDPIQWDLPWFRFLNKERAELPDIDIDLSPSKRPLILNKIREERGELNVVQVATFGTTTSKSAIQTACRGYRTKENQDGIDVDIAQYLSSLVPSERGITRSLTQCINGDEEKGFKPIRELINQFNQYPGLLDIALGIEGLIVRRGQHASGVMMYNNSPYDTTALMRSPNGDITTQFDLHKSEALGDTKFDYLVTEICDKLSVAIDLLVNDGYFSDCKNKKEIYNKYLYPSNIDLKNPLLWKHLEDGDVQDVFQFNTLIGIETAKAIKPKNPTEMTAANALLRLAAPEGQERPLNRYLKFKKDISLWYKEMSDFGLTEEEQKWLEPYYLQDYGVPSSQEVLMRCVMDKHLTNFTLAEANSIRKCLAKKKINEIPLWEEKIKKQSPSLNLGNYIWETMARPQMSYSFSINHALPYSFVGIQTLAMATLFPIIYWNCACLIVNSQSIDSEDLEENVNYELSNEEIVEDENDEEDDNEDEDKEVINKKKKKIKTVNYGKIATAMGKMRMDGISINPPNINNSTYTFSPDVKNNTILYGLSGITGLGDDKIKEIMLARPYNSLDDLISKVKLKKPQIINLIKAGAFDEFGDRLELMKSYVAQICGAKQRVTLQNMQMMINYNMIPEEYKLQEKVFNFNKYIKKFKSGKYYNIDDVAFRFYSENFDIDNLVSSEDGYPFAILQTKWDSIYQSQMDIIRPWVKKNAARLLIELNNSLMKETWDKYCLGSISKWEMDSTSCYFHEHELAAIDMDYYNFEDYFSLPTTPEVETTIRIKNKIIPIFRLSRIAGTVLDRDKNKKTVSLLTPTGVVTVKIYGERFSFYDRQISEKGADGKKHIIRKSEFARGNKIIVTGIRQDDGFLAKTYSRTPFHSVETISNITENGIIETYNRDT